MDNFIERKIEILNVKEPSRVQTPRKSNHQSSTSREAAAVLPIISLTSVENVPSIWMFLSSYNLGKLSTTSIAMKLNANNEAKNQLKDLKVILTNGQTVFECLRREEQRPLFMTQVDRFKLSKPTFYQQLIQVFNNDLKLTNLNLSNNQIGKAEALVLAEALHHNSKLKLLNIDDNQIDDAGIQDLAEALHHNSSLTLLDAGKNRISDEGAQALAKALHHNSTLKRLFLYDNQIGDEGAQALAKALHHNSTLMIFLLGNNRIRDASAKSLTEALLHNRSLTYLYLAGNEIGDAGRQVLAPILESDRLIL